jgi:DNA replication protein DnaC
LVSFPGCRIRLSHGLDKFLIGAILDVHETVIGILTVETALNGKRKDFLESLLTVSLLIIDDFGMRRLPLTAAEELLEIMMRCYERASTVVASNRPVEDWGKLLSDAAAVGRH